MGTARIVGGDWRRRVIRFPDAPGLRPTPDRVRETLFNWLGQDLAGMACLDLFAGSGALGFEAASRGAAQVTLVEADAAVCAALRDNARLLEGGKAERMEVVRADAVKFAKSADRRYDLLFLDPPFRQDWFARLCPLLPQLLAADGLVYAESETALEACGEWRTVKHGRAGQVHYHLMQRQSEADGTGEVKKQGEEQ